MYVKFGYNGNLFRNLRAFYLWLSKARCGVTLHYVCAEHPWHASYLHGLILIPAWISNYIDYKLWDDITYPFPNFTCAAVEVWEWISNFIPHRTDI